MDTPSEGTSQAASNVLDFRTGQTILPKKLRSILKGQYVESADQDHNPDKFVQLLEQRLLSEAARTTISLAKGFFQGGKDE